MEISKQVSFYQRSSNFTIFEGIYNSENLRGAPERFFLRGFCVSIFTSAFNPLPFFVSVEG